MNESWLSVILLHDQMVDKQGTLVTASLTPIDIHDIARSCRTYGVRQLFIAHPSPSIRKLARVLIEHWQEGFGSTYNPNRKEALSIVEIVNDLDEALLKVELQTGRLPRLVATSARAGTGRILFSQLQADLGSGEPHLLMLGTGWGMSPALLERAALFLEPIRGPGEYNHLSVRSACAIMLDRLLGR